MRGIGSVYVNVFADTKRFNKQVESDADDAGRISGEKFGKEFEHEASKKKFDKMWREWEKDQDPRAKKAGDSLGKKFSKAFKFQGMDRTVALVLQAILLAAEPAAAAVEGLASAGTALASSLGVAASSGLALVPVVASLGLVFGTLKLAFSGYSKGFKDGAVEAQAFKKTMDSLKPALVDIKQSVQGAFFANLSGALKTLAATLLPQFKSGLTATAGTLNTIVLMAGKVVGAFDWAGLMASLQPIIKALGTGLVTALGALLNFLTIAAPAGQRLAGSLASMADRFAAFIANNPQAIADFLDRAQNTAGLLSKVLEPLGKALFNIMNIGATTGDAFLKTLADLAGQFQTWTQSIGGQQALEDFFKRGADAMKAFTPVFKGLATGLDTLFNDRAVKTLQDIGNAVGKVLPIIGSLLSIISQAGVLDTFARLIGFIADQITASGLLDSLSEFAHLISGFLFKAMRALMPVIAKLVPIIADLVATLVDALGPVFDALVPALMPIVDAFAQLVEVVAAILKPLLVPLGKLLAALAPILVQLFIAFNPVLRIISLLGPLLAALSPVLLIVANALAAVIDWLAKAVLWLQPLILWIVQWISNSKALNSIINGVIKYLGIFVQWISRVITWIGTAFSWVVKWGSALTLFYRNVLSNVINAIATFVATIFSKVGSVLGFIIEWAAKILAALTGPWRLVIAALGAFVSDFVAKFTTIKDKVIGIGTAIVNWFKELPGKILSAIGDIGKRVMESISLPDAIKNLIPGFASGGIVYGPTRALIGEAGPEAIVPLTRPLNQIDPSVRAIAAMLRGGAAPPAAVAATGRGGPFAAGVTLNVYPVQSDPMAVAASVMNRVVVLSRH